MKQANNIVTPIPDTNIQVHLRATEPEDLDILYKIENDDSLWNLGNTNVPYSKYVLHDYIAHATNDTIPPLIHSYIELSPTMKTFGTTFDPDFGDAYDTAMIITLDDVYESKRNRYINTYFDQSKK